MPDLDDKFLEDVGLDGLPTDEKQKLLKDVYDTLEVRVGVRLTNGMSDAELDAFEALINEKQDREATLTWLKTQFPHYEQVVADELESLKAEIKAAQPQILSGVGRSSDKATTKDLFKQLGLEKLTDQEKFNLSEDLGGVALDRIASRLEAILTPEQASEFETMLHTDEKGAFELLERFVPDYPSIVQEEIQLLRDDVTATHAEVMKKLNL
jgi:hypothetical protein